MATDMTPRVWPSEARGLADDAVGMAKALRRALRRAFRRVFRRRFAGSMVAGLALGQVVTLGGSRPARVECLEGVAWVTCPSDGRDVMVRTGQAMVFTGPGVAVSSMGASARIRVGWR